MSLPLMQYIRPLTPRYCPKGSHSRIFRFIALRIIDSAARTGQRWPSETLRNFRKIKLNSPLSYRKRSRINSTALGCFNAWLCETRQSLLSKNSKSLAMKAIGRPCIAGGTSTLTGILAHFSPGARSLCPYSASLDPENKPSLVKSYMAYNFAVWAPLAEERVFCNRSHIASNIRPVMGSLRSLGFLHRRRCASISAK